MQVFAKSPAPISLRTGLTIVLITSLSACSTTRGPSFGKIDRRCDSTLLDANSNPGQAVGAEVREAQLERGRPRKFLDATGRIAGAPRQLILWNSRIDNHHITAETEQAAMTFLEEHDVSHVLVRSNEYDPLGEWSRLRTNRQVGAGWRYTVGAVDVLLYTVVPGRLIGQDWYNPFTDTIHLYSDIPAIAVHEAAYAADVHGRRFPGTYAVTQHLPLLGMYYRTTATQDTLEFIEEHGGVQEMQAADKILYPLYYGAAAGQIGTFIPVFGHLLLPVGAVVGHVVGHTQAHRLETAAASKPVATQTGRPATNEAATAAKEFVDAH